MTETAKRWDKAERKRKGEKIRGRKAEVKKVRKSEGRRTGRAGWRAKEEGRGTMDENRTSKIRR